MLRLDDPNILWLLVKENLIFFLTSYFFFSAICLRVYNRRWKSDRFVSISIHCRHVCWSDSLPTDTFRSSDSLICLLALFCRFGSAMMSVENCTFLLLLYAFRISCSCALRLPETDVYLSSNQIDRAPFIWTTMSSWNHERRKDPNRIYSSSLSLSLSLGRCNYHSLMAIMSYCPKIYEVVFRPQVGHFQQVNLPPNDLAVNN